jgi:hypothetical protein
MTRSNPEPWNPGTLKPAHPPIVQRRPMVTESTGAALHGPSVPHLQRPAQPLAPDGAPDGAPRPQQCAAWRRACCAVTAVQEALHERAQWKVPRALRERAVESSKRGCVLSLGCLAFFLPPALPHNRLASTTMARKAKPCRNPRHAVRRVPLPRSPWREVAPGTETAC